MSVGDLVIKQGTDEPIRYPNVRSGSDLITDWTGYVVRSQIRERPGSPVLHEWTTEGAAPNVSYDGSDILLELDHDLTSTWEWPTARIDVKITNPGGLVGRLPTCHVTLDREITR